MSDILREADEALEREKFAKLWKEYGPVLILALIVLVISTAGFTAYRTWDASENHKETSTLLSALGNPEALEKAAGDTRKGHEAIALLNAAAIHADKKDFAKAAELYGRAAQDSKVSADLRDLASILQSRSTLLAAGDKPDYKAALDIVLPVAKKKGVFAQQAQLDAAALYGDGLKDYAAALELLKGFDKDSTSDSLQEKANALRHVYQFEQGKSSTAKETPAS